LEETRYYISFKQLFFSLKFQYNFVTMSNDSFKDNSNNGAHDFARHIDNNQPYRFYFVTENGNFRK